ncbi:hypothetical protein ACJMK2_037748 [Sinanodonta woodiana]|uniref:Uncharacterized protein n=1 Tax=Sinanodonta woodiana TaxID=1069815 RepID=A0ABD3WLF3_SINWO
MTKNGQKNDKENYSCAPPCDEGQKRDDNDMCAPIGTANINQTAVIGNMNITDEVLTKTTRTTPLSPTTAAEKPPIEIIDGIRIVVIPVLIVTLLILSLIGLFVCWKFNILQKCKWSRKPQVRRQSSTDALSGVELVNMAPQVTNVFNVQNLQFGDGNVMKILKLDDQAVTNGDAAGLDSSSVENQGRKACVDEERGNPNINPPDCPGNFRSIHDETDAVYNLELMVEVAKSVGIIRGPGVQGTGFRVGESCIMTALHVVRGIINPGIP